MKQHKYSLLNTSCKLHNNLRAVTTELTALWEAFKDKKLKILKITWNFKKKRKKHMITASFVTKLYSEL